MYFMNKGHVGKSQVTLRQDIFPAIFHSSTWSCRDSDGGVFSLARQGNHRYTISNAKIRDIQYLRESVRVEIIVQARIIERSIP